MGVLLAFCLGIPYGYIQIYIVELVVVYGAAFGLLCGFSMFTRVESELVFGFILLLGRSMSCIIRSQPTR